MPSKMKTFSCYMEPMTLDQIGWLAGREGISRGEKIRQLIEWGMMAYDEETQNALQDVAEGVQCAPDLDM